MGADNRGMSHARGDHTTGATSSETPQVPGAEVPGTEPIPAQPGGETVPAAKSDPAGKTEPTKPGKRPTRVSGAWISAIVAIVLLALLLVFILQNLNSVTVYFLGAAGSLPVGVAMLLSALGGMVVIALIGGARILQLKRQSRRLRK
jgi:uncharacterized integral membrane protein